MTLGAHVCMKLMHVGKCHFAFFFFYLCVCYWQGTEYPNWSSLVDNAITLGGIRHNCGYMRKIAS